MKNNDKYTTEGRDDINTNNVNNYGIIMYTVNMSHRNFPH